MESINGSDTNDVDALQGIRIQLIHNMPRHLTHVTSHDPESTAGQRRKITSRS
ncbi:hypothetical protein M404DRAFT_998661 [Pisolithus tinctorius Marx 270]|uniref:Uncharacterized protein n=1 Tax=Pisolithus tinctorius Marx 270 TaxID=870435 RepID=A0A0C3JDU2_PISTI|nr:hypothetical protein M404DRAFT_998661 [Pisolithus tinctorius Marx 270]